MKNKKLQRFKENPIFLKLAVILTLLYLVWHLGRWYEYKIWNERVEEFKQYTTDTFYFVDPRVVDPFMNATSDLFVTGGLEAGRCLTQEGLEKLNWIRDNN